MPSSRRLKATGLLALLTLLTILYITHGTSSTHNSPFYTRTVAAIQARQSNAAREDLEAKQHQQRLERVEREHKVAMSAAKDDEVPPKPIPSAGVGATGNPYEQKPIAGRKMMGDGKVVHDASGKQEGDDGVAKVGNVGPQASRAAVGEDEEAKKEQQKVETALNEVLKKGPIIVFSKSYCPFSKKAKHILLDLYNISPPPYVVELDQHELGPGLQKALEKMTGRRTVPNVLVNGRSIGGGDDIEELHVSDKLMSTISTMGGKRIMKVEKAEPAEKADEKKAEMKFKA
ncbi:uncharacterized protein LTR77_006605 [Saxophila tyrrhenica]|uniref:Glutaredoxin domain-containing protein n=1 Tax=Saxophila tyrrhenica TaxID=1690608 RepID=A0AAV9P5B5_9PEZI|nr:hypothetical protein LTR77_006605 [Saxophila tyrrhenica]